MFNFVNTMPYFFFHLNLFLFHMIKMSIKQFVCSQNGERSNNHKESILIGLKQWGLRKGKFMFPSEGLKLI